MPDYSKGKIYKITSLHTDKIYIGSTIQPLCKRLWAHSQYVKGNKYMASSDIVKLGDYKIILIHNFSCSCREELFAEEQRVMDTYDKNKLVNCQRAHNTSEYEFSYHQKYRKVNKIRKTKNASDWYQSNKERIAQRRKDYYAENKYHMNRYRTYRDYILGFMVSILKD